MKLKLFILLVGLLNIVLISLFFFSCGFVGGVGTGAADFLEDSRSTGGDPGNGDTPRLSSRVKTDPDLADEPCEESDRCKEACRDIYKKIASYKKCYLFSIEKVSLIEDVFYILLKADSDDLADIEEDDLETYINTGKDGWRDKVVSKQIENSVEEADSDASAEEKRKDLYKKLKTTLEWILEKDKKVAPVLEAQDRDNEILEKIILEYCNINSSYHCRGNAGHAYIHPNPVACDGPDEDSAADVINFGENNKMLFVALSFVAEDFFKNAMDNRRYDAFALGHKLVEKACNNRGTNSQKCIDAFYRFVREVTISGTSESEKNKSREAFKTAISNIAEEIEETVISVFTCP